MSLLYPRTWDAQFVDKTHLLLSKQKWAEVLVKYKPVNREVMNNLFSTHAVYPPSVLEFQKLCEEKLKAKSNLPEFEIVYYKCLARDLVNPVIGEFFKRINTWDLTHDSEKILRQKLKILYAEFVSEQKELVVL